jgi:hypothetical protein
MSLMNKILLIVLLLQLSCKNNSNHSNGDGYGEAKEYLMQYLITKDTAQLKKSYEELISNEHFEKNGLNDLNKDLVIPVFMYLRKYDELFNIVQKSEIPKKNQTLNLIRSLQEYKHDPGAAKKYIAQNINRIKQQLESNAQDSLLYIDYFIMRLYQVGREQTMVEVDSFKTVNNNFSDLFYNQILEDVVKEYPEEFLYIRE